MAGKRPRKEFGTRRPEPLPLPPKEPVKRSGHVALLVMGTIAVGSTAFGLMPRSRCQPDAQAAPGALATPGQQHDAACSSRGSSGGSGYHSSRWGFSSGDSSSRSSSGASSDSGGVTRGGFGSFAHAFGSSGRG